MSIEQRVAIITGASRGIGRACAFAFAREVYRTALFARNTTLLAEVAKNLKEMGAQALPIRGDVREPQDISHAVYEVQKHWGRIDVLVNNAGVGYGRTPLMDFPDELWHETIDVNLTGIYYWMKAVLPIMKKQRSGVIINISSGAGKHGIAGFAVYCASKFGVIGLTESVADEVEEFGIKVLALCPGGVDTEMHHRIFPEHEPEGLLRPEEVATKIVSLADPKDRTRTGSSVTLYRRY
ncbi:MAG TPA: SDR family oxidoreductase [Candidatus Hypogeohydataceae bacterium YC41]